MSGGVGSPLVFAYAGGPSGPAAIAELRGRTGLDVVTVTLDLGQGDDLGQLNDEARSAGAVRAHVIDARERLALDVVLPVLRAGAAWGDAPPGPAVLARPAIAAALVDVARIEGAAVVAHGAADEDAGAFARLIADLAPDLRVLQAQVGPLPDARERIVSNLWGRAVLAAAGADGWALPERALYTRTAEAAACENHPALVELTFDRGVPVAVSGIPMSFPEIVDVVDTIAGDHGVGRTDAVRGPIGARRRELGEAPAAAVLSAALAALEHAALEPELLDLKTGLVPAYTALLQDGGWFGATRRALDAFVDVSLADVSGTVQLMLSRGSVNTKNTRNTKDTKKGVEVLES